MKKILIIFMIATMLITSILPVMKVSSDPVDVNGYITYTPNGGGNNAPIEIVAIWETNGLSNLDDDLYAPGCQIDPPVQWNAWSKVCVYVAVYDPDNTLPDDDTNVTKIDISWPDNDLTNRPDLGQGGMAENGNNIEPVIFATWSDYEDAYDIDTDGNIPFICYYNSAKDNTGKEGYAFVYWATSETRIKFYKACYDLYYHYPAGWYDANVTVQEETLTNEVNYFQYVYKLGIKTDFDSLNWGSRSERLVWHAIDGDWEWEGLPTIKNIGNWDTKLSIHFSSDDFGPFGPSDPVNVLFDWRAGESNPIFKAYNQSYCEKNGIPGMKLCSEYGPLPINNNNELNTHTYDDALLKCHKAKLDFYIWVIQWYKNAYTYSIDIDIYANSPTWQPSPHPDCVPCCNEQQPEPEADIGITKTVDNSEPVINTIVEFTITVTNHGPDDATNIIVNDLLPDGLEYVNDYPSQGSYNSLNGDWNVGNLANGDSATLTINATVKPIGSESEFVQLAMLLDGSGSISNNSWDIMREGLADAIENCFPIGGSVELTIIQFGGQIPFAFAQVEIYPVIVNNTNYNDIISDILNIAKIGAATPTACAINLAADTLKNSPNFNENNRQIINLVTDGKPNCECNVGEYTGVWKGDNETGYALGKTSAEAARNYLLNTLNMTAEQDEFDAEAVGNDADVNWLKNNITWPGNYEWTGGSPPGPGWVRQVENYTEFAATLCEKFAILFEGIKNSATVTNSNPADPNSSNNAADVEITPQP